MDRGAWWAILHGVKELDMTKHSENIKKNLKINTEALGLFVKTYQ